MRNRIGAFKFLMHIGLPCQPLHVGIAADADEALAALVVLIPEMLHDPEDPEDAAMFLHEASTGFREFLGVARDDKLMHGLSHITAAEHRVIDAFAGRRR